MRASVLDDCGDERVPAQRARVADVCPQEAMEPGQDGRLSYQRLDH